jgi:hypothetical protein
VSEAIPDVGRLAGDCGYQAGAWHKQPMLLGYSDTYRETISGTSTGGTYRLYGTIVPDHEVWVVERIAAKDYHHDLAQIELGVRVGDTEYWLASLDPPAANWEVTLQGPITIGPGEHIVAAFLGTTDGDSLYLYCHGRKVSVS